MKRLLPFLLLACGVVEAQTPSLTFGLETTTPDGQQILPRLTWSTEPVADQCSASGADEWSGQKPSSGNVQLPGVTTSRVYGLACTWSGVTVVALAWTPPTTNTDGSALTNLAGYRIQWGSSADNLTGGVTLNDPTARSWTGSDFSPGKWFFGVRARNSLGLESGLSNIVSKEMTASQTVDRSLGLTITFPNPPVLE